MGITVGAREAAPGALQSYWCSHTPAPVAGELGLLLTQEGLAVLSDWFPKGNPQEDPQVPSLHVTAVAGLSRRESHWFMKRKRV